MTHDRRRRRVTAPLLLLAAAACSGEGGAAVWGRGEAVRQLVQERVARADSSTRLDLRDLAPFRWESLVVLAPGTPLDSVRAAVGAPLPGEGRLNGAVPDSLALLVFSAGGDVVAASLLPRSRAELPVEAMGRRYAPDSAAFRVEPLGEGRGRLVRDP